MLSLRNSRPDHHLSVKRCPSWQCSLAGEYWNICDVNSICTCWQMLHTGFFSAGFADDQTRDDVNTWKRFPHYCPFVRGIYQSPVDFLHKGTLVQMRFQRITSCHHHILWTPLRVKRISMTISFFSIIDLVTTIYHRNFYQVNTAFDSNDRYILDNLLVVHLYKLKEKQSRYTWFVSSQCHYNVIAMHISYSATGTPIIALIDIIQYMVCQRIVPGVVPVLTSNITWIVVGTSPLNSPDTQPCYWISGMFWYSGNYVIMRWYRPTTSGRS